jgi:hypothetical protein
MSVAYDLARLALEFVSTIRSGDIESQKRNVENIELLKRRKMILSAETLHELDKLKIHHEELLKQWKEKHGRITRDYKEFLDSIDDMKQMILTTFKDMPKPMAYIIHHKAREMLDDSWQSTDEKSRELCRAKLANFMLLVAKDAEQALIGETKMPVLTIEYIKNPSSNVAPSDRSS